MGVKKGATLNGGFFSYFGNVVKLLEDIIILAIDNKASDIHIREFLSECILEYRIDGNLIKVDIEKNISINELISRIKILSRLNLTEKRLPQDGSFSFEYKDRFFDIRVATLPTINGENIVLRILNSNMDNLSLQNLGFDMEKEKILRNICKNTHGIFFITGPTGSGKSTTLLSLMYILNDGKRKIISIEDPVENKLDFVVQVQVKEEIGLSFEKILKSTLRSDPDIIIISEIRDEITAKIAIRAALTGHLVLTTLHTNDVISTFSRLIDMQIPKYLLLDSLLGILSQRLIFDEKASKRICVSELLEMNEEVKEIFFNNVNRNDIERELKKIKFKSLKKELEEFYEYNSI